MKIFYKLFLLITLLIVFNIVAMMLFLQTSQNNHIKYNEKNFTELSLKLYHNIETMEKSSAHIVALTLATNPKIIQAYLDNDRDTIVRQAGNIWKTLKVNNNIIYEIHFFKPGAVSFVDFYDIKHYGQDLSTIRKDIVSVFKDKKSSEHFWVCKLFPGLRSTFPIKDNNGHVIGVVSIGLKLINYAKLLSSTLKIKNILSYKKDILRHRLSAQNFEEFKHNKHESNKLIVDTSYAASYKDIIPSLDFSKTTQTISLNDKKIVVVNIPIKDKMGEVDAYLSVIKPLEAASIIENWINTIIKILLLETLFVLFFSYFIVSKGVKRINRLIALQNDIAQNDFTNLNSFSLKEDANEFSILEKNTIKTGKRLQEFIESLQINIEKFQFQAEHDTLTTLFNRRTLETLSDKFIKNAHWGHLCAIMVDIDHFKNVNDSYGHTVGDHVLRHISSLMSKHIRKKDFIFRYGGEEFLIILQDTTLEDGKVIAENLRASVENIPLNISDEIFVTISCGVATYKETHKTIFDIIADADDMLYRAKESGRNKVCY